MLTGSMSFAQNYNPYSGYGGSSQASNPSGPAMYLNPSIGTVGSMKMQAEYAVGDVGTIIGRGGERVRRIKHETGASVNIAAFQDNMPTRVATILGPPKGVAAALHFIAVAIGMTRQHQGHGALSVLLRMDPKEIGTVIGKGGQRINAMRDESGARIEIDPKGGISLEGLSPNLAAGLQMVIMQLHEQRERFGADAAAAAAAAPAEGPPAGTAGPALAPAAAAAAAPAQL